MSDMPQTSSTRPYFVRAIHEWCTDNGLTPYLAVFVDRTVQVPREFVRDGQIVLNVSGEATSNLVLGNDFIEFKARFGGQPRSVRIPLTHVSAIYARENGEGMAFSPVELPEDVPPVPSGAEGAIEQSAPMTGGATSSGTIHNHNESLSERSSGEPVSKAPGKPVLTRIK
jgi:stringent starvation protein B